ncbi:hypothetical protein CEXT_674181 [Caerostris extrusa]|uniref:Uncharacterized protein n=1 Tax=Caerostris extrusa TaxID=172846 RepID=A0AAV4T1R7_CAEEX|nr:hypothetical protein CEXT_674181 [Caerostris extrusa]
MGLFLHEEGALTTANYFKGAVIARLHATPPFGGVTRALHFLIKRGSDQGEAHLIKTLGVGGRKPGKSFQQLARVFRDDDATKAASSLFGKTFWERTLFRVRFLS